MACRIAAIPARDCASRRSSRTSSGIAASKSVSYASDYSEIHAVSDTDGDDIDDDVEFLQSALRQCKWMGLAQFAMIPLVFLLAKLQCTRLTLALVIAEVLLSLIAQVRARKEVADWVCEHAHNGWQKHVEAVTSWKSVGILPLHELLVYFGTLTEALDPAMDAWTAANSETMCTLSVQEKFAAAWEPIPMVGHTIGSIGLPRVLLVFVCVSSMGQVYQFLRLNAKAFARVEAARELLPSDDLRAHRRWHIWIFLSHMTDVGGLMLLQDVFLQLVQVEIGLCDTIWPVPDRNTSFRWKIILEALPALWLQISLLSLTWESATTFSLVVTFVSLGCSYVNILKHLLLVLQCLRAEVSYLFETGDLWRAPEHVETKWTSEQFNCIMAGLFALGIFTILTCSIRLAGIWGCPSHILNLSSGCVAT
ncbi:Hypothetical protein SCF082_LOCUS2296 [Durusdinium trenchii]|uniref:Uncharacterized protein n=1 Tax=Durusdinium trenchii TaxID=1381693 RepID=A0ABP0HK28_9DINO